MESYYEKNKFVRRYSTELMSKGLKPKAIKKKDIENMNIEQLKAHMDEEVYVKNSTTVNESNESGNNNRSITNFGVGSLSQGGFGYSYVVVYKIISIIASFVLSILIYSVFENIMYEESTAIIITIVFFFFILYILLFFIKLFENISIIARNSCFLVEELRKKNQK